MVVALIGNPNCGKTTLYNALTGSTQYVGNWPGVTVEKKEGRLRGSPDIVVADLPGVYSLEAVSPDEKAARDFLQNGKPDVLLNIVDATNLERNLYLTTQLIELGLPMIVALNVMDVAEKNGDKIDVKKLSGVLHCPVIPMAASKGKGLKDAKEEIVKLRRRPRGVAGLRLPEVSEEEAARRYQQVDKIIATCVHRNEKAKNGTRLIDRVLLNRVLAFPLFAAVMWAVYAVSVNLIGGRLTDWVNHILFGQAIRGGLESILAAANAAPWIQSLLLNGILEGVGSVLSFVPQIAVLFFLISLLEDCGYMARVAFLMDRLFKGLGLSGKSFIPMLIGTGCSVPAILASRTVEDKTSRRMTVFLTPFIPCSAKLPLFALIAGTFFPEKSWVAPSMYFVGILAAVFSGLILKNLRPFRNEAPGFVMELPQYRAPNLRSVGRRLWERVKAFVVKAGTVIFIGCGVIWFLQSFNWQLQMTDTADSMLSDLGRAVAPFFSPLGFGSWEASVATLTGILAKENIVASFGILLGAKGMSPDHAGLYSLFTPLGAYSFMLFNLLAAPCIAAISAMHRELGGLKWTLAAIGFQTGTAYLLSFCVYQIGRSLFYGGPAVFPILILVLLLLILWQVLELKRRKRREPSRVKA